MNLVRFLLRQARGTMILTAVAAALGGVCNAGLIALINVALHRTENLATTLVLGFAALGLGKVLTNFFAQLLLARYAQEAIASLRQELSQRILSVPLRKLEEIGTARLMVALSEDVLHIAQALLSVPGFGVNLAMLAGGAAYLGWLSWKVLLGMLLLMVLGAFAYRSIIAGGFHQLHLAREVEDRLFNHFRALTEGVKELKLHRSRRSVFLGENIQHTSDRYRRFNVAAETRFIIAHSWAHLLFFTLIALVLFALPRYEHFSERALTGYVLTVLYLMGPLAGLMASFSVFGRAKVALGKIEELGASLTRHSTDECPITQPESEMFFERLELRGVTHTYHHEKDDNSFVLGPLDLSFHRGELVFLVGGNGSGKSTLAKIVTGLYLPEAGAIRLNGKPVTEQNRDDYRQIFSAVFSDFYLFDSLLGLNGYNLDLQAQDYLAQLHLNRKVKVHNGVLSTTALSQGQRKRLALLTAYLEDRPFYLFDEWASDQDPQFKDVFYYHLLPELKARGKTVLVITHDDKYFQLADRILKLDYGQLVASEQVPARRSESIRSIAALTA